jgi:hypothetical protein
VLYDRRQVGLKPVPYQMPLRIEHPVVDREYRNTCSAGRVQTWQQQSQLIADLSA